MSETSTVTKCKYLLMHFDLQQELTGRTNDNQTWNTQSHDMKFIYSNLSFSISRRRNFSETKKKYRENCVYIVM